MNIVHKMILLLTVCCFTGHFVTGAEWAYTGDHGPSHWASLPGNEKCGAMAQSPIDIPDAPLLEFDSNLKPFRLTGYDSKTNLLQIVNNGHTAQLNIIGDVEVEGGALTQKHKTAQLHFHWGGNSNQGSEHLYNKKAYPLEMHIVNFNSKYGNLSAAASKADGLAVLGFWFMVTPENNEKFAALLNHLTNVKYADSEADVTDVTLSDLVLHSLDRYIRYKGSLTTPPCFESVTWTLFEQPISISEDQLNLFRALYEEDKDAGTNHQLVNNFRPVQSINSRRITRSFKVDTDGAAGQCAPYLVTVVVKPEDPETEVVMHAKDPPSGSEDPDFPECHSSKDDHRCFFSSHYTKP